MSRTMFAATPRIYTAAEKKVRDDYIATIVANSDITRAQAATFSTVDLKVVAAGIRPSAEVLAMQRGGLLEALSPAHVELRAHAGGVSDEDIVKAMTSRGVVSALTKKEGK